MATPLTMSQLPKPPIQEGGITADRAYQRTLSGLLVPNAAPAQPTLIVPTWQEQLEVLAKKL
jgi:hypothetical protein